MTEEWGMQLKLDGEWTWIHPTGGEPYRYDTKEEAEDMLRICYPDEHRLGGEAIVRVRVFERGDK